ncbi:MAG: sodium:solute symporter, partial [Bacteroidota bacterium]
FCCIVLFSFVGIYAQTQGLAGQAAVEVSKILGVGAMLVMNFIMVTSAASTLDSAFSSASKMVVIDLGDAAKVSVSRGRLVMVLFALAGTIPIFFNPEILSATTVSGTMVLGLAPVFLLWKLKAHPLSFHLAVSVGVIFGIILAIGAWPANWVFFAGKYGDLLSVNLIATALCFILYLLPSMLKND